MKQFILALTVVALAVAGASAVRTVLAVEVAAASPVPQEHGGKVTEDQVPAPVMRALKNQFPNAKILQIREATSPSLPNSFGFTLDEGGRNVSVQLSRKGLIRVYSQLVKDAEVPAAAKKVLKAKYPRATVEKITMLTTPLMVRYEYRLKTETDIVELEVDAQGMFLWDEVQRPAGSVKPK